jgi:hypothetical protein
MYLVGNKEQTILNYIKALNTTKIVMLFLLGDSPRSLV